MEQTLVVIQKLMWFAFRAIYTLVPPIIFLFSIAVFVRLIDASNFPPSINGVIHYISDLHQSDKSIAFVIYISASVIIGLLTETISGIVLWDKKYDKTGDSNGKSYFDMLDIVIEKELRVAHVGYADLTGVKIINEYENFNSFTLFILSSKLMLLAIYIYTNFYLIFLVPLVLILHYGLASYWYFVGGCGEVALVFCLFLITRRLLDKLKSKTPNWCDKVIAEAVSSLKRNTTR